MSAFLRGAVNIIEAVSDSKQPIEPIQNDHVEELKNIRNLLFIASNACPDNIADSLTIRSFDPLLMMNYSPQELLDNGINHLWLNISKSEALTFLKNNIALMDKVYFLISVVSEKRSKYLVDIEQYIDKTIKYSDLCDVNALNEDQLVQSIKNSISIHQTANCLASCLGISRNVIKKNA